MVWQNLLAELEKKGNLRELTPVRRLGRGRLALPGKPDAPPLLDLSSNDYLAFAEHPRLIEQSRAFLEAAGSGAGAARLMSGDLDIFHALEDEVAALKDQEAALIFGSGYMANCGLIPALAGRHDVIFADRLDHASIYDGCRLAGARLIRFNHNDLDHLEDLLKKKRGKNRALIVVESLYSMDGDICPLAEIVRLKERYDCLLMVDEAHATGLYGPKGAGLVEEAGLAGRVDIVMGTFSKALGSYGAYVAGSSGLKDLLINRARSFIFSTALPPAVVGASLAAVRLVREEPGLRRELFAKVDLFKELLRRGGVPFLGTSQIIPVMVGKSDTAVKLAAELREDHHIFATAVRPPTVPEGTARLRFSITRNLSDAALEQTAATLVSLLQNQGINIT